MGRAFIIYQGGGQKFKRTEGGKPLVVWATVPINFGERGRNWKVSYSRSQKGERQDGTM